MAVKTGQEQGEHSQTGVQSLKAGMCRSSPEKGAARALVPASEALCTVVAVADAGGLAWNSRQGKRIAAKRFKSSAQAEGQRTDVQPEQRQ